MEVTEFAIERTTAVTDLILGFLALFVALHNYHIGKNRDQIKTLIWSSAFGLMAFASLLGAIAHGFVMTFETNWILWQPINFSLGLTVSLFVVGVIYDLRGFCVPKSVAMTLLTLGVLFYGITLVFQNLFMVFIVYEGVAMVFSLVVYAVLTVRRELIGSAQMAAGIMITLVASAVQASGPMHLSFIWEFDHNGIFHLVQMVGLIFFVLGLRAELLSRAAQPFLFDSTK